jgi:lantibiotic biosynthesis protein
MDSNYVNTEIHQTNIYALPDGQTGQLLKLLESYVEGQKDLEIEFYIKQQIKFLVSHIQEVEFSNHPTMSHFPFEINLKTGEKRYTNEFSWSRGDLSVLVLLYKADKAFGETHNQYVANTVGNIISRRTKIEEINQNPFIRNGTAGIAQCFYTLYNLSRKTFYKEAYQFWITETYRLLTLGYSGFSSDSLLDGMEGVSLVLETFENGGNADWSKRILL